MAKINRMKNFKHPSNSIVEGPQKPVINRLLNFKRADESPIKRGRPPMGGERRIQVTVSLPRSLEEALFAKAHEQGRSASLIVEESLKNLLQK